MTKLIPFLMPAYLFLCLLLGGASNGGFIANLVLQLLAVILLIWTFWKPADQLLSPAERQLVWLLVAAVILVLLQFLPLPVAVWELSGMRAGLRAEAAMAGITASPLFISLLPHGAVASAVWALPALALATALLRRRTWRVEHFVWALLTVVALSVAMGGIQLAGGGESAAYLYAITNQGSTVGFFANSNHLATLLLVSLPFLAALIRQSETFPDSKRIAMLGAAGALFLIILAGLFVNGSLAGYGLFLPVLAASVLILFGGKGVRRASLFILPLMVLAATGIMLATSEEIALLADDSTLSPEARQVIFSTTWQALRDFLPFGSGLGSFAEVYHLYENPALVEQAYVNHAHNDYLELLLETGIPGGVLLGLFLTWWLQRAWRIWIAHAATPFTTAAVVASGTILVHSIVDYPLRTGAISVIFLFSCVLMTSWISGDGMLLTRRKEPDGE